VLRSGGYSVPGLSCTRAAPGELNSRAALPGQAWRRAHVPQAALKYRGSFLNAIVCMCARRWCHRACDTCARTRTGVRAGSHGPVSNAAATWSPSGTTACASCSKRLRRPLHVDLTRRIECLIEYPHDPLPGQGINFEARSWHSLALTASFEFSELGWSIGDSNPGPLACQARADGVFLSSAANFEIDSRSVVCSHSTRPVRVIECLFEYPTATSGERSDAPRPHKRFGRCRMRTARLMVRYSIHRAAMAVGHCDQR
jgi:hypothetical protein